MGMVARIIKILGNMYAIYDDCGNVGGLGAKVKGDLMGRT